MFCLNSIEYNLNRKRISSTIMFEDHQKLIEKQIIKKSLLEIRRRNQ